MKNLTRMDVLGARKIIWKIIRGNKEVIKGIMKVMIGCFVKLCENKV